MTHAPTRSLATRILLCMTAAALTACGGGGETAPDATALDPAEVAQGQQTFRFDTFGDETQWTDALRMHEVIGAAVARQLVVAETTEYVVVPVAALGYVHIGEQAKGRVGFATQ